VMYWSLIAMNKTDELLKSLNIFIQKAEEDEEQLQDIVPEFPGLELLPELIENFESSIAVLLRAQRKRFLDALNVFVSKDTKQTLEALLAYIRSDLFVADEFSEQMSEEAAKFFEMTLEQLCEAIMKSIDKDVPFEVLSGRSIRWIDEWAEQLGKIMQLNTHQALESELIQAIEAGESIAEVELRIKNMPQFDRNRARATARTEILTASSQANWESFMQSPSVKSKKWKRSSSKKSTPRETHVAMDGVEIGVDELFLVDGEFGMYPRDTTFSPKNRVNCGCVLGPVVDEEIIGLSKEEKEAIRQEVLLRYN